MMTTPMSPCNHDNIRFLFVQIIVILPFVIINFRSNPNSIHTLTTISTTLIIK